MGQSKKSFRSHKPKNGFYQKNFPFLIGFFAFSLLVIILIFILKENKNSKESFIQNSNNTINKDSAKTRSYDSYFLIKGKVNNINLPICTVSFEDDNKQETIEMILDTAFFDVMLSTNLIPQKLSEEEITDLFHNQTRAKTDCFSPFEDYLCFIKKLWK